ncbi:P-selectin glycoprotein ligand 1 isoform X1 [Bufo gargarizans]|uniref:P-selectin glycoprotein ligand 1 isoform X1 n=1 Tax=Bufo gargarizans TaxID=30331 RepID=UPI001CF1C7A9|nr:P-selectin glycoprotein ligand 1 isoform X1 [Bufo gargarizans]
MSFLSTTLRLCVLISCAIAYKHPLLGGALLTDDDNLLDKPNNPPFGISYKWEWQSQATLDDGTIMSPRFRREIIDKKHIKGDVKPDEKILPKVKSTKPPLKDPPDTNSYILKATSAAFTKAKSIPLFEEDETTPLTDLEHTTTASGQTLSEDETTEGGVKPEEKILPKVNPTEPPLEELSDTTPYLLEASSASLKKAKSMSLTNEDETTPLTDLKQTTKGAGQTLDEEETTHVEKSVTQSKTLHSTTSEEFSVLPNNTYKKATTVKQVDSTSNQQTSTNDKLLEDITSSFSLKAAETSPTLSPVTSHDQTTGHDVTTVRFLASPGYSSKPAAVTHTTTSSEDKVQVQSIMRQCMITILILAVICTIFIISTIALAAKLSTMRQKNKLRLPVSYTEMSCISSLMPDGDHQNKPQDKRLKTFAATLEESVGDNTTLHSFLPDH